jgi:hypothetical protein
MTVCDVSTVIDNKSCGCANSFFRQPVYLLRRVAEPHLRSSFQPWPSSLYSCWLPQELLLLSWHSFDRT